MSNRAFRYSPDSDQWAEFEAMPIPGKGTTHVANVPNSNRRAFYFIGGLEIEDGASWPNANARAEAYCYSAGSDTWTRLPNLPAARGAGAGAVLDDTLYFFGGASYYAHEFRGDHADTWALDLANPSNGWQRRAYLSLGRNHLGGVAFEGRIYAIGGQFFEDEGCSNQAIAEAYDPISDTWVRIPDMPVGVGHISPSVLASPHGILVVGGVNDKSVGCHPPGKQRDAILHYHPGTNAWTAVEVQTAVGASAVCGLIGNSVFYTKGGTTTELQLAWD